MTTKPVVYGNLMWVGLYAAAMGILEAVCIIWLRRLPQVRSNLALEPIREVCTILMLIAIAWLGSINLRLRTATAAYAVGVWDIFYYAGLYWLTGWPKSLLDWDCLFLIPIPWYAPVLAPILISFYMISTCWWIFNCELRAEPIQLSFRLVIWQQAAFWLWFISFVQNSSSIAKRGFGGATYSWTLLLAGVMVGFLGLWFARPVRRIRVGA